MLQRQAAPTRFDPSDPDPAQFLRNIDKGIGLWSTDGSDAEKIKSARTLFDPVADRWWSGLSSDQQPTDWAAFCAAFLKRFRPVDDAFLARKELRQIRYNSRGSISAFAKSFQDLMTRLPTMHEDDRIHAWIESLPAPLARVVARDMPTTLDAAISTAIIDQGLWQSTANLNTNDDRRASARTSHVVTSTPARQRSFRPRQSTYQSPPSPPTPVPMADLGRLEKLTAQAKEDCRRKGLCFRCRQPDHMAFECPKSDASKKTQRPFRSFRPFNDDK